MRAGLFQGLICGAFASAALAGTAQATVKDGVDAWQGGDYAKAIGEWRGPADAGDADAQFNLAQAYKLGRGVPADLATAQSWYRKAAEQGHEQAQANLGLILFQNGDRANAMPWIRKAADRGEPRAQYVLGTAMFNGDLADKDWPRAYALMTRAAAAGLPQATTSLAQMDKYIPLGQRQQGVEIARTLVDSKAQEAAEPAPVRVASAARPAAPSIRPVDLPPSGAGATSEPPMAAAPRARKAPRERPPAVAMAPVPAPAPVEAALPPPPPAPKLTAAPPKPKPAALAAAGGRWRIQLGAFATPGAAEAAWGRFSGSLAGLGPSYIKVGAVTRLQAGPLANKPAADRACSAARGAGAPCFPVAP